MKILSVVTLVSPDGAYGGPLRVAVNQARALIERGHEVRLVAGHEGYGSHPPTELEGVPATLHRAQRLVPRTGFAGLVSPGLLADVHRNARTFDVAHVHFARDLVTLPAVALLRRAGLPYVLQTHGMVDPSDRLLARVVDPLLTLPALKHARQVLHLTGTELVGLRAVAGNDLRFRQLTNGVPSSALRVEPDSREVLYLARLAPRKRPRIMIDIARALSKEFPDVRVRLVGPDEGEGQKLEREMKESEADLAWEGPLEPSATLSRMSRAGVYVLPSVDEPYCMTVLEAMSIGLPVVITSSNGLASMVRRWGAGVVTGTDTDSIVDGVRRVMADPTEARRMGQAGLQAVRTELGMDAIAEQLEELYLTMA